MKTKLNILLVVGLFWAGAQCPLHAQLPNAWQITDNSTASGSAPHYTNILSTALQIAATNGGFRYAVNARILSTNASPSMIMLYGLGTKRFLVQFNLTVGGELTAALEGGSTYTLTTNGTGNVLYHTHEIIYDATNGKASYIFDGQVKTTNWTASSIGSIPAGTVYWGSGSSSGQGTMNFHSVSFEVTNNIVASYDAGNSPTIAPEPETQGWTLVFESNDGDPGVTGISPDTALLPAAMTLPATDFTTASAILHGEVNPSGSPTMAWFEWGTDTNYGSATVAQDVGIGVTNVSVLTLLDGLVGGPNYHYRMVASNSFGVVAGSDHAFDINYFQTPIPGLPAVTKSSVAWGDYDNDGRLDFLLSGRTNGAFGGAVSQLWRNTGNGFSNVTATVTPGLPEVSDGSVAWGDFDDDGRLDFLLTGVSSSGLVSQLWWNLGGVFLNATPAFAMSLPSVGASSVAWGDYDNDGQLDFLLTGSDFTNSISQVWRNMGNRFVNVTGVVAHDLPGVVYGSAAWGDYDNDGWLDFLLTGYDTTTTNVIAQVWRNTGEGFTNATETVAPGLSGVIYSSVAWGNYDNDGHLDFLLTGQSSGGSTSQLWRNTGSMFTKVTDGVAPNLQGVDSGFVAWGDYDNNGWLDFLITGKTNDINAMINVAVPQLLWRNNGSGFTNVTFPGVPALANGSLAWADYDNDGRLDFLITGDDGNGSNAVSQLWRINVPITNDAPSAPATLTSSFSSGRTELGWSAATDAQTPSAGLSYNLRVGTNPGGADVISPQSFTSGFRLLPSLGNAQMRTNTFLNLPTGTYYWSVQAIDTAFAGGPFAPEASFVVPPPSLTILQTNNGVVISWAPQSPGFLLQESLSLSPAMWTNSPSITTNPVVIPVTDTQKFYRLIFTPPS